MNCTNCGNPLRPDIKFCPTCGVRVDTSGVLSSNDPRLVAFEQALGQKYRIIRKIGSGGFAEVYLGEHTQLGREVAIKILVQALAQESDAVERFRRESKAVAKLSHPNIIDIYDVGESGEIYYFVMKYIAGETLAKKLRREKKIQPAEAVDIVAQLADALAYAHDHDVVHRDIKPANVMLNEYGKPVLMDFGIARVQFGGQLTRTGALIGTPHYLPPEQPLGKQVDGRSDIYSLGIMFYEMLAGKVPFHDEAPITLIYKHINEPPPPLAELAPELPEALCKVVHKMIEKLQENRYQSADDVLEALDAFSTIYPLRLTPSSSRRSTPAGKRNTEKLLILARQHLEEKKLDKAAEIYKSILLRHPDHPEAKANASELLSEMAETVLQKIGEKKFEEARNTLTHLDRLSPGDVVLTGLRYDLEREEQKYRKDSEFKGHYEAAVVAMKHENASQAVDALTRALTINPDSKEANALLREARSAFEQNRRRAEMANAMAEAEYYHGAQAYEQALTAVQKALDIQQEPEALALRSKIQQAIKEKKYRESEQKSVLESVDGFCEQLNFDSALQSLQGAEADLPAFVKAKRVVVEEAMGLYQKYKAAEDSVKQGALEQGKSEYEQFLASAVPPFDYQSLYGLKKKAEQEISRLQQAIEADRVQQDFKKADVLLRIGKREEAIGILEQHKENPDAAARLRQLRNPEPPSWQLEEDEQAPTALQPIPVLPSAPRPVQTPSPPSGPPRSAGSATPIPGVPKSGGVSFPAKESQGLSPTLLLAVGIGVLILTIIGFFIFWNPKPSQKAAIPPQPNASRPPISTPKSEPAAVIAPVTVTIDAAPWANIEVTGGSLTKKIQDTTPALLSLAPGRYSVIFKNPDFQSFTQTIEVTGSTHDFRFQFRQLSAEKLVDSLVK